ncbi:MAG: 50S ribosomal protein L25 [Thermoguttaceae bacterium]
MADLLTLSVERRDTVGKRRNRRLRESGKTPAVLYGHKKEVVTLSVSTSDIEGALRHGHRFVKLDGAVADRALIKDLQWDPWGETLLHVDFERVAADERVQLSVPIVLRGEAKGVKDGGVVKQTLYRMEIETDPASAPENIVVIINDLGFDEQILVSDIPAPEGVKFIDEPETLIVECSEQIIIEDLEEESEVAEGAEPEVIGEKTDEDEEEAEE